MRGLALAAVLAFGVAVWAGPPQPAVKIEIAVVDQSKLAVPAVRLQLTSGGDAPIALDTDENGLAVFLQLRPAKYHLSLAQKGFEPVERDLDLSPGVSLSLELTLVPARERTQIEVKGEEPCSTAVEQGSSPSTAVSGQ